MTEKKCSAYNRKN